LAPHHHYLIAQLAQSLIQGSQDLINLNTVNLYGVDINNPVLKQAPNTQDKTPPWMSYE